MDSINLKSIEKKVWLTSYQDGIWDIYWGVLLLGFGISPILEDFGLIKPLNFLIFPILAFLILFLGKKYISVPRMGMINFGEKRKSDHKRLFILGIITFIITVIIFFIVKQNLLKSSFTNSMANTTMPVVYAIIFISALSVIAYFMDYKRLYFYAFLFGLSIPLAETLYFVVGEPMDGLIAFSFTSAPILITGIILLFKFVKTVKPILPEVNHD
jgi:hypothetical protein